MISNYFGGNSPSNKERTDSKSTFNTVNDDQGNCDKSKMIEDFKAEYENVFEDVYGRGMRFSYESDLCGSSLRSVDIKNLAYGSWINTSRHDSEGNEEKKTVCLK